MCEHISRIKTQQQVELVAVVALDLRNIFIHAIFPYSLRDKILFSI